MSKSRTIMKFYKEHNSNHINTICPNIRVQEKINNFVCDVFIGSDTCVGCAYFKGIDTDEMVVTCSFGFIDDDDSIDEVEG